MGNARYEKYKDTYEKYREKNKDKRKKIVKKYYLKNKDKLNKQSLEFHDKKNFGGMREITLKRDNYKCVKCGMSQEQHKKLFGYSLTVDHIDGKGRNSEVKNNAQENLQTLCLRCHGIKDYKMINK